MNIGLSAIVAMTKDKRVIGKDNKLPWHISNDLKRFKQLTINKSVIMGINTYNSIGKPLPNRINIVLTKKGIAIPGVKVFKSIEEAIDYCYSPVMDDNEFEIIKQMSDYDPSEIFIIGGEYTYKKSLNLCTRLYITEIHKEFDGDTFFPMLDKGEWKEVERIENITEDGLVYHYVTLDKIKNQRSILLDKQFIIV